MGNYIQLIHNWFMNTKLHNLKILTNSMCVSPVCSNFIDFFLFDT